MTCVVGSVARGKVSVGADSIIVHGDDVMYAADPKVWQSGPALVGAAGDWIYLDLLRRIDFPAALDENWLRYGFTAAFRKLKSDLGLSAETENEPDGEAVIGALGALWWLDSDSIIKSALSYAATGIGQTVAMGALAVLPGSMPSSRRCLRALEAAEKHCSGVRGPFTVLTI